MHEPGRAREDWNGRGGVGTVGKSWKENDRGEEVGVVRRERGGGPCSALPDQGAVKPVLDILPCR